MLQKNQDKKDIFKSKNGAELAEKMVKYFKKYTIPESQDAIARSKSFRRYDPSLDFNGELSLFNN